MLGTRNLGDILSEREAIASEMQQGLDSATAPWGVLVERVEVTNSLDHHQLDDLYGDDDGEQVKDVRVPENLQRAMAAEAEAARNARAKVRNHHDHHDHHMIIIVMTIIVIIITMMTMLMGFSKKVIAAEGEHKASRALRHAAEVICDSPAALQVI